MDRTAPTDVDVHHLLQARHSPYAFDPQRPVSREDLRALLEAARWAMSSYNEQPWRYVVGVKARNPDLWQKVHSVLLSGNQPWAANAPVLALGIVEHHFKRNGKVNKAATHDLGAASAFLTLEATARGLVVHQMIGIDPDQARNVFNVQPSMEPLTALAIGYEGRSDLLDPTYAERDAKPRTRMSLEQMILEGEL